MAQSTRLFSRSMGRWLMALMLVMLSSLATRAAEAYACYTSSNTTLTFYYDNLRSSRTGTTYDLNTDYTDTDWETDGTNANVTKVVFDPSFANARPTITYAWFYGMGNLQSITGISYLNTSEVTNMAWMFGQCENLTSLDLSGFNTANVTDMRGMFTRCNKLTTIYASSSWSTAAVTDSYNMFNDCTSLVGGMGTTYNSSHVDKAYAHIDGGTSNPGYFTRDPNSPEAYACYTSSNTTLTFYYDNLRSSRTGTTYDLNTGSNITGWETSGTNANVTRVVFNSSFANARPTTTYSWFYGMGNLQSITGMKEYLKTSAVTNMAWMFSESTKLTTIDLSGFNTAKVTDMRGMFSSCNMLTTIYVGSGWSTAAVTSSNSMFENCTSLVGGKGTTYNANHTDKAYAHIDGGTSNPGYFTGPMAYACYTPDNTTLTFYYDSQRSTRPGTTYDLNTEQNLPGWHYNNITKVVFNPSFADARPTTTYRWFDGLTKLTTITGMNYLNTSEVTDMGYMFYTCSSLTSLDLSSFNTSKVTDMQYMFFGCSSLTSLNLSNFNTSKVTDMQYMFYNCSSLTSLNLSNFNTSNVTKMGCMFGDCSGLTSLNVSSFNTSNVTWMSSIFAGCSGLTSLNLSNFNTANVTSMLNMFAYCSSLTSLNVSSFNTSNVTEMGFMFQECSNLTSLDLSSFNTSQVTYMGYMFSGCTRLTSLDLSSFNTSKATYMGDMFSGCTRLTSLDLSSFNTSKVTNMGYMFQDCSNLQTVYVDSSWSTAAVASSYNMFSNCTSLVGGQGTTYDANHVDAAYAHIDGGPSNPGYLSEKGPEAYACYTPSNTTLTFYYDNKRYSRPGTTYDLNTGYNTPGWETDGTNQSVTNIIVDYSFAGARPTTTYHWFYEMRNLTNIPNVNISYLNTSEVTNMKGMFAFCSKLSFLGSINFNTSKVTDMDDMFMACDNLTSLDLSNFNTSKVTYMRNMFQGCENLMLIYVGSGWTTAAVTKSSDMFLNCIRLSGGRGTRYSLSNPMDKTYAHIDYGPSNPGYFTDKNGGLRGDVNGNGIVNISDVTDLISLLLGNGTISNQAADCNQDSNVNISDVTALISYLLSGTW